MYERFYGLRERPFNLTSNPRYLLLTSKHAEGLSTLQYGISNRLGIIVLLGEAGTGKTTIIRAAVASQTPGGRFVMVSNPLLTRGEFLQHLADGFGLSDEAVVSKTRFLSELTESLTNTLRNGGQTALIVDEAHALPHEILEEIRLLANIETDDEKLLPVVLAGQPELRDRLNEPGLRQLKQRVALRCSLGSLQIRETATYIAGRIGVAGGDAARLFTPEAVELIHQCAQGLPRTINVICDNALVSGFAADERPIGRGTVLDVCRDLDLTIPEVKADQRPVIVSRRPDVSRDESEPAVRSQWEPDPEGQGSPRKSMARVRSFRPFFFRS
jgi:general secretion pathway protein A